MDKKKLNLSITNDNVFNLIKLIISVFLALLLTFIVLCFVSEDPVYAITTILFGPLRKARYFGTIIEKTIPYAFAGLSAGILFKAGFFNLGGEGIFTIAGVSIAAIACNTGLSSLGIFHPVLCFIAAILTGSILMMIPGFFKSKYNANEMVISLMLNSIYAGIATFLVNKYLQHPTAGLVASQDFASTATIGYIIDKWKISACFFLLIITVIVLEIVLKRTKLGYQIRLAGTNPKFSEYSGISAFKLSMITSLIAGALAGIGSACQTLTQTTMYIPGSTVAGIGFAGCLLAMLGKNQPIGTVIAAFFIQYLEQGTRVLYMTDSSVPAEIVAIVEGVMVLLISSSYFLQGYRRRKLLKEGLGKDE